VIESGSNPVAVIQPASSRPGRLPSEIVALAEAHSKELGYEPVMDAEFADDLEEIIRNRTPADHTGWE
jgi:hypothetical protein